MNSANPAIAGRTIMVVEDEYLIAVNLELVLTEHGAKVLGPFSSVDQALSALSPRVQLDAAVLDINVRGRMVFPVAEKLTEHGIPFVFATGYDKWTVPAAFTHIRRFEKPTDIGHLVAELSDMLVACEASGLA